MFSLRRITTVATRTRPVSAFSTATFNTTRHARPQNLSELRTFESLLALRYSSDYERPSYNDRERPSYNDRGARPSYNDRGGRSNYDSGRGGDRRGGPARRAERSGFPTTPTNVIYVGNFRYDTTEASLRERFEEFGKIEGVRLAADPERDGLSRGYGWIEFESITAAAEAVEKMHSAPFEGRPLSVQYVSHKLNTVRENPPSSVLFIGNLPFNLTDEDLDELFKDVKGCIDVRIAVDKRTGQPRGFAHADFKDIESCVAAKTQLTGTQIYGRMIRTDFSSVPEWKEEARKTAANDTPAIETEVATPEAEQEAEAVAEKAESESATEESESATEESSSEVPEDQQKPTY
ncbi:hypothetical protein EDC01DRAFT_651647 [Geopyxis carbonaria]|nr:hypothetical protein EDC01DRAFT_651647 [Geopyxis carbonaria]